MIWYWKFLSENVKAIENEKNFANDKLFSFQLILHSIPIYSILFQFVPFYSNLFHFIPVRKCWGYWERKELCQWWYCHCFNHWRSPKGAPLERWWKQRVRLFSLNRVSHSELTKVIWVWQTEICKLYFDVLRLGDFLNYSFRGEWGVWNNPKKSDIGR